MKNKTKTILFTSLIAAMILPFTMMDFAEAEFQSPLKQIKNGVALNEIQCNDNKVLAAISDVRVACVNESTAEKKGWDVIATEFKTQPVIDERNSVSDTSLPLLVLDETESVYAIHPNPSSQFQGLDIAVKSIPHPLSYYPTDLKFPSSVELNQPFETQFIWQFFTVDDDGDIDRENTDYSGLVTLKVSLPESLEFVNYKELGYKVVNEILTDRNEHTIVYHKPVDYNETEINTETVILKFTSMPLADYFDRVTFQLNNSPQLRFVVMTDTEDTITITPNTSSYTKPDSGYYPYYDCGEKCQHIRDNVRGALEFKVIDEYAKAYATEFNAKARELSYNEIVSGRDIEYGFYDYFYHNHDGTAKEFLETESASSILKSNDLPFEVEVNVDTIIEKYKAREASRSEIPLDVDFVGKMFTEAMNLLPEGGDIQEVIKGYNLPEWFLDDVFEKYPELSPQNFDMEAYFFYPSLDWILPSAYAETVVTLIYGNVKNDLTDNWFDGIKICIMDWSPNENAPIPLYDTDGNEACAFTTSTGYYGIYNVVIDDPDRDGTNADVLPVVFYEDEDRIKIISYYTFDDANYFNVNDVVLDAPYSGYVNLGVTEVENVVNFLELYNLSDDVWNTMDNYHRNFEKVTMYYDISCQYDGFGAYLDPSPPAYFENCIDDPRHADYKTTLISSPIIITDNDVPDKAYVVAHEYGHYLHDEIGEDGLGDFPLEEHCVSSGYFDQNCESRSYSEGFAEYFLLVYLDTWEYEQTEYDLRNSYLDYENRLYKTFDNPTIRPFPENYMSQADVTSSFWDISDFRDDNNPDDSQMYDDIRDSYSGVIGNIDEHLSIYGFETDWLADNRSETLDNIFYLNFIDDRLAPVEEGTLDYFEEDFDDDLSQWWDPENEWEIVFDRDYRAFSNVVKSSGCDYYCILDMTEGVDLSQYDHAELTFDRLVSDNVDDDEGLYIHAFVDGNWEFDLATFTEYNGEDTNSWEHEIINLDGYTDNSYFRIMLVAQSTSSSEIVLVDNVNIIGTNDDGGGDDPPTNTPPTVSITSPTDGDTFIVGDDVTFTATTFDADGDTLTLTWNSDINGDFVPDSSDIYNGLVVGLHTITATVNDGNGGITTDAVSITVNTNDIPVITLLGDATVNLTVGDSYTDAGATAADTEDGDITSSIVTVNPVDTTTPGTYIVTYDITDSDGNAAIQVTRTVDVISGDVPLIQEILSDDGERKNKFGHSVAIDGNTALVGAPNNDKKRGAAYVYENIGGIWHQTQKLIADDRNINDHFGKFVAIDGNHMIIGSSTDNSGSGNNAGSAYIFENIDSTWVQTQKLFFTGSGSSHSLFGAGVSIYGDTIMVGAHSNSEKAKKAGTAFVFEKIGSTWTETQRLYTDDPKPYDYFGQSISIYDDTAVFGTWNNNHHGKVAAGSAYIFEKTDGMWNQAHQIIPNEATAKEYFGRSVSIYGDTIIIGATGNDEIARNAGSAYVFNYDGSQWTQNAKLLHDREIDSLHFGTSVSMYNDRAVIGSDSRVFIFDFKDGEWLKVSIPKPSDAKNGDMYGTSVSISNSVIIVGSSEHDENGLDSGSAYLITK